MLPLGLNPAGVRWRLIRQKQTQTHVRPSKVVEGVKEGHPPPHVRVLIGWCVGLGIGLGQMRAMRTDLARMYEMQAKQAQLLDALSDNIAKNTEAISRLTNAVDELRRELSTIRGESSGVRTKVEANTNLLSRLDERTKYLKP